MKTPALNDIIQLRQGELSRTLAGCAAVRPVEVLGVLDSFDLNLMTDQAARSYLWELRKKRGELRRAEPEARPPLCVDLAIDQGWPILCVEWLSEACQQGRRIEDIARDACNELKGLVITRATVESLARYASGIEAAARWGVP